MLDAFANRIILLWGWRRWLAAFLAGAVSALMLAPFDLWPLGFVTVPLAILLLDGAGSSGGLRRRLIAAAAVGWWLGFGYFLAGLWWIGASFLVDAAAFAWLLPVGVVGFPAALALFWAFGAALSHLLWSEGAGRVAAFAAAMTLAEWLRGHILTGFPWNAFGYALMPGPTLMQVASLVGLWGVTLLAFLVFAAPVLLVGNPQNRERVAFAGLFALFLADATFGLMRISTAGDLKFDDAVRARIVQPAIDQGEKWDPEKAAAIFQGYLTLSDRRASDERQGIADVTHLIWPESALPFLLTEEPGALAKIADLLPPGTTLITGAARAEPLLPGESSRRVFNSIYVIDDEGGIDAAYDKVHLVPFGEYLPLRGFLESFGLSELVETPGGFSAGPRHTTIALPGTPPFAPLICYEIIFPGEAVVPGERPSWLLNVTNDGWYGNTPGPRQHFRQARVRAVEEGLPLVRAANTGISGIVDPYGRVVASLGLGLVGVVDGPLPSKLSPTPFARHGDLIVAFLGVIIAGFAIIRRLTRRTDRR